MGRRAGSGRFTRKVALPHPAPRLSPLLEKREAAEAVAALIAGICPLKSVGEGGSKAFHLVGVRRAGGRVRGKEEEG